MDVRILVGEPDPAEFAALVTALARLRRDTDPVVPAGERPAWVDDPVFLAPDDWTGAA